MGDAPEPRLLYWRIVLVGWGTVLGTAFFVSAVLAVLQRDAKMLPVFAIYSFALSAVISVMFAIPMLAMWVPVFAMIRKRTASIRRAVIITTTVLAAIGAVLLAVIVGLANQNVSAALTVFLPWLPVPMVIAACLASCAFGLEENLGTR